MASPRVHSMHFYSCLELRYCDLSKLNLCSKQWVVLPQKLLWVASQGLELHRETPVASFVLANEMGKLQVQVVEVWISVRAFEPSPALHKSRLMAYRKLVFRRMQNFGARLGCFAFLSNRARHTSEMFSSKKKKKIDVLEDFRQDVLRNASLL